MPLAEPRLAPLVGVALQRSEDASGTWWGWFAGYTPGLAVVAIVFAVLLLVRRRRDR